MIVLLAVQMLGSHDDGTAPLWGGAGGQSHIGAGVNHALQTDDCGRKRVHVCVGASVAARSEGGLLAGSQRM